MYVSHVPVSVLIFNSGICLARAVITTSPVTVSVLVSPEPSDDAPETYSEVILWPLSADTLSVRVSP